MTDYTELIRSLRCENTGDDECGSSDCPYWSGLGCMDGQLMEDVAAAIEALQAASPWHRVEEMPKDGLYGKIVCDTEGQISVCRGYATVKLQNGSAVYTDSRLLDIFKEETDNWNWEDITHFTHWMPMPEPPKEGA